MRRLGVAALAGNVLLGTAVAGIAMLTLRYTQRNVKIVGQIGPTGPQGVVGPRGATGSLILGATGPNGAIGPSSVLATGGTGPQGETGALGPVNVGPTGDAGPAGSVEGPTGPTGSIGAYFNANRRTAILKISDKFTPLDLAQSTFTLNSLGSHIYLASIRFEWSFPGNPPVGWPTAGELWITFPDDFLFQEISASVAATGVITTGGKLTAFPDFHNNTLQLVQTALVDVGREVIQYSQVGFSGRLDITLQWTSVIEFP